VARSRDRTAPIQGLARNAEGAHDIAIVEPSKLNVYIENLLPGALILAQLTALVPKGMVGQYPQQFAWLMSQAVAGAVTFTAAAYLLGALAVTVSKLLLDGSSAHPIRPILLRIRYPKYFARQSKSGVNDAYGAAIWTAERNAAEDRRTEIQKRRERGRLIRGSLLPAMLALWTVKSGGWFATALLTILCYAAILILYAYSEVELFRACRRDIPPAT